MDPLCYLCFFVILSYLFLVAFYSPAGKGLASWLSCAFVTFQYGVPGQVGGQD